MNVTPETELMILLECAEDAFPLGRVEDFSWHAAHPGESAHIDAVLQFRQAGWVEIAEVPDAETGRKFARARLTGSGQVRIGQLNAAGIRPARAADADDVT